MTDARISRAAEVDEHRYALMRNALVDVQSLAKGSSARIDQVRAASKAGGLECLVCRQTLTAKLGEHVRWHFAHRADCEYRYHEPESALHRRAKGHLLEWALSIAPGADGRQEWRLPEIRQIADVLVRPVGRRPLALEIQYADLSAAAWRTRHDGYASIGLDDIWFLGHSRLRLRRAGQEAYIDQLASALVGSQHPLLYLHGRSGYVTQLLLSSADVFRAATGERLGWTAVISARAPLRQLTLRGSTPVMARS